MISNFHHLTLIPILSYLSLLAAILLGSEVRGQEVILERDSLAPGLDSSLFQPPTVPVENRVNYTRSILNQSFDFKLAPISNGKFEINISGNPRTDLKIRVYDVIGNLLYEEDDIRIRGFQRKELDLSEYKSNFFIIEIGNQEVNKTKSIVAI